MAKAKPKFKPAHIELARKVAEFGFIDTEIAQFLGIGVRTLYDWRSRHPEFAAALRVGKSEADERVKRALYLNAVGHTAPDGKYIPSNTTACIFWLKNRQPEEWREKFEHDHGLAASREKLQELLRAVEERLADPSDASEGKHREPRRTQ